MRKVKTQVFLRGNPHGEKPRAMMCATREPQSTICDDNYNLS
jgi:hypothetical protein